MQDVELVQVEHSEEQGMQIEFLKNVFAGHYWMHLPL